MALSLSILGQMEVVRQSAIAASGCSLDLYLLFRQAKEENPNSQRYVVAKGKKLLIAFAVNLGKTLAKNPELDEWSCVVCIPVCAVSG